jgi:hypothetical protein
MLIGILAFVTFLVVSMYLSGRAIERDQAAATHTDHITPMVRATAVRVDVSHAEWAQYYSRCLASPTSTPCTDALVASLNRHTNSL